LRGYRFPSLLKEYRREYEKGITDEAAEKGLRKLLKHCREKVPYYAELLSETSVRQIDDDPRACLRKLPLLTKDIIRAHFDRRQVER
jgi:phenylacetate-coenzyme A ligase PaaK-like adenylate-forming protein